MTAYPRGPALPAQASLVNRVVNITAQDLLTASPDTLTLIKRQVNVLDLLEVSDNPAWAVKVALLPVAYQRMFQGGNYARRRYRYQVYGYQGSILSDVLYYLVQANTSPKTSGWLRLAASQQSSGEWTPSIVDVLNAGNPVTQTDTDRRAAVGAAANGLPTAVFDGTDVHVWPLNATINNMTTKLGFWIWYKPSSVTGIQTLINIAISTGGGVGFNKIEIFANTTRIGVNAYVTNIAGRQAHTPLSGIAIGTWYAVYVQYDSSRGGDANLVIFINGVSQTLSFVNIGAGATLGALQSPTGNALIGGTTDVDTPSAPLANGAVIGPNIFAFNDNLTAGEIANLLTFEAPV